MSLQSTDSIADVITRIRNAIMVGKNEIRAPHSKLKQALLEQLKAAGYITDVKVEAAKPRDILHVTINKENEKSVITEISRMSKPGRRVYVGADEIPRIKSGRGIVLISTSKGVITGHEAKKQRLGGELLIKVY